MKLTISFILLVFLAGMNSCSDKTRKVTEETYPDGSPKVVRFYKDGKSGKEMVKEIDYYSNRNKRLEGEYKSEQRDGRWVYYYENGNIWSEGYFKDGVNNGSRITYFENGHKRYEGTYRKGDRVGKWTFYRENGELEKEIDYGTEGIKENSGVVLPSDSVSRGK